MASFKKSSKLLANAHLLIFTDLDGTLLDHHNYSYDPAIAALTRINDLKIPLVLCSSKTEAEISTLKKSINNHHPYIVENGGSVIIPAGYFESMDHNEHREPFGLGYNTIIETLGSLRKNPAYRFQGFNDFSIAQLSNITGLSPENAKKAKQRASSEPILWQSTQQDLDLFKKELTSMELNLIQGGRFYHVMGRTDKARAVKWLIEMYQTNDPHEVYVSVALGDSANDIGMLQAADIPVVIKSAKGDHLSFEHQGPIIFSETAGPSGWQTEITEILTRYYET